MFQTCTHSVQLLLVSYFPRTAGNLRIDFLQIQAKKYVEAKSIGKFVHHLPLHQRIQLTTRISEAQPLRSHEELGLNHILDGAE